MRTRSLLLLVAFAGATGGTPAGEPEKRELRSKVIAEEVNSGDSLQILSLDPRPHRKEEDEKKAAKLFHEYRILGTLLVKEQDQVKSLQKGLTGSLSDDHSIRALCFRPRHGIVVSKGNKVVCELLICYECKSAELYDGDTFRGVISVQRGFEKELNALLTENKIPIHK